MNPQEDLLARFQRASLLGFSPSCLAKICDLVRVVMAVPPMAEADEL
jgi:hypothetical protein